MFGQIRLPKCLLCIRIVWINCARVVLRAGYECLKQLLWKWLALEPLHLWSRLVVQRIRREAELWNEKGCLSSVNPFLCTSSGIWGKVIKCAHWEICFSLRFRGEKLPAKGGSQIVEDWGWSGFLSWTHHLALIFDKVLNLFGAFFSSSVHMGETVAPAFTGFLRC